MAEIKKSVINSASIIGQVPKDPNEYAQALYKMGWNRARFVAHIAKYPKSGVSGEYLEDVLEFLQVVEWDPSDDIPDTPHQERLSLEELEEKETNGVVCPDCIGWESNPDDDGRCLRCEGTGRISL